MTAPHESHDHRHDHLRHGLAAPHDDLCLELVNTLCWRGSAAPQEALHGFVDALAWCGGTAGLGEAEVRPLAAWATRDAAAATALFAEIVALRETLFRIFGALAGGGTPAPADIARLNAALAEAPPRSVVEPASDRFVWRVPPTEPRLASLLAPVLWSAADLLVGPRRARLRQCANAKCLWLFLDDSKSGTRRWCSMSTCGNRAKAHRHYLRQKLG